MKNTAVKKAAAKKAAAKKRAQKTTGGREPSAGKPAAKAATGGKALPERTPARKAAVKKSAARATAKMAAVKKSTAKSVAKTAKTTAKKAAVKKPAVKKTTAERAARKTTPSAEALTASTAARGARRPEPSVAKRTAETAKTAKTARTAKATEAAKVGKATKKTGAQRVVAKKTTAVPQTPPAAAGSAPSAIPGARTAPAAPEELAVRPGEEPWTPEEVETARGELGAEVERLRTEITSSEAAITGLLRDSGDGAGDDQADTGTKNITREHEMALTANAREMLVQTEHALERLDAGTYGLCESCGRPIGKARMQAFPRATLCVECKQQQERR